MVTDDHVTLDDLRRVLGDQRFAGLVGQVKQQKAPESEVPPEPATPSAVDIATGKLAEAEKFVANLTAEADALLAEFNTVATTQPVDTARLLELAGKRAGIVGTAEQPGKLARANGAVAKARAAVAEEALASLERRCTEWARSLVQAGEATPDTLRAIFRNVETDHQTGQIYVRARPLRPQVTPLTPSTRAARLKRLDRTQELDFRVPILKALEELGGRARVDEVLELVEREMQPRLTPDDYEPLPKTGQLRWRNTAQFERKHMIHKERPALLSASSPHGWWEVTEAGREYLRHHRP